jgi:hypothetical protein
VDLTGPLDHDRTDEKEWEKYLTGLARVPTRFTGEAALVQTPAGSGGYWEMACPRRCAGSRGDLEGLVFVEVLVQERKQVAAGDRRGGSVLRPLVGRVDLLQIRR